MNLATLVRKSIFERIIKIASVNWNKNKNIYSVCATICIDNDKESIPHTPNKI